MKELRMKDRCLIQKKILDSEAKIERLRKELERNLKEFRRKQDKLEKEKYKLRDKRFKTLVFATLDGKDIFLMSEREGVCLFEYETYTESVRPDVPYVIVKQSLKAILQPFSAFPSFGWSSPTGIYVGVL